MRSMKKKRKSVNPVAKFAHQFNKALVITDKKKKSKSRKTKHKRRIDHDAA